jgi:hypothetical protein
VATKKEAVVTKKTFTTGGRPDKSLVELWIAKIRSSLEVPSRSLY